MDLKRNSWLKPLRNRRGVALQIALFFMLIMTFVAMEVSFDTNVEYIVSSQEVNRLKAYYAAKMGVEISLLRIAIYQKIAGSGLANTPEMKAMLDPIWNFPFAWPPSAFIPENAGISGVDQDLIKTAEKESFVDVTYSATISAEGSRIDINDLGSDSEELAKATRVQIQRIFQREMEHNEEFRKKYQTFDFERFMNHIADWIDADQTSRNGGTESSYYDGRFQNADNWTAFMPPNQSFRTINELHSVPMMTDDLFNLLAPRVTVFGVKGININYSEKEVLKALDIQMTDEVVNEIITRRNTPERGGPFKDLKDFQGFIGTIGVNTQRFNQGGVPLLFDAPYNFRIDAMGTYGTVSRRIIAIVFDVKQVSSRLATMLNEEDQRRTGGTGTSGQTPPVGGGATPAAPSTPATPTNPQQNSGRPTVVYWEES